MDKVLLAVEQTKAAQPGVQQEVSTSHTTSVATAEKPQYSYFRQLFGADYTKTTYKFILLLKNITPDTHPTETSAYPPKMDMYKMFTVAKN